MTARKEAEAARREADAMRDRVAASNVRGRSGLSGFFHDWVILEARARQIEALARQEKEAEG